MTLTISAWMSLTRAERRKQAHDSFQEVRKIAKQHGLTIGNPCPGMWKFRKLDHRPVLLDYVPANGTWIAYHMNGQRRGDQASPIDALTVACAVLAEVNAAQARAKPEVIMPSP